MDKVIFWDFHGTLAFNDYMFSKALYKVLNRNETNTEIKIGDMGMSDMVMAKTVGAKGILVRTGVGEGSLTTFKHTWANIEADYVAENVLEAVKWIIEKEN